MIDKVGDVSIVSSIHSVLVIHIIQVKKVGGTFFIVYVTSAFCFFCRNDLKQNRKKRGFNNMKPDLLEKTDKQPISHHKETENIGCLIMPLSTSEAKHVPLITWQHSTEGEQTCLKLN